MLASRPRGFTLIELVVVITILGILAAFAVPKFIVLDQKARLASLNGLAGSVKSAASLARGMAMASGTATGGTVSMEGQNVQLYNFYPDSSVTGIMLAVNSSADFTFTAGVAPAVATYQLAAAPTPANCLVTYTPATTTSPPVVATTTTGC